MIIGLGTDIIETSRIEKLIERRGVAALERIFTSAEIEKSKTRGKAISQFRSGRWAVKEAMAKALGCGMGEKCSWQEIEVMNLDTGAPTIALSGTTKATADALGVKQIHVSISHEKHYASAVVVLEK
jgi:holo-[acyl-carrier protein] synthase